jgi:hypothetical protein
LSPGSFGLIWAMFCECEVPRLYKTWHWASRERIFGWDRKGSNSAPCSVDWGRCHCLTYSWSLICHGWWFFLKPRHLEMFAMYTEGRNRLGYGERTILRGRWLSLQTVKNGS